MHLSLQTGAASNGAWRIVVAAVKIAVPCAYGPVQVLIPMVRCHSALSFVLLPYCSS